MKLSERITLAVLWTLTLVGVAWGAWGLAKRVAVLF